MLMILLVSCVSAVANTGSWANSDLKLGTWEEIFNGAEGNPGAIINANGNDGQWNLTNLVSGTVDTSGAPIYKTAYASGSFKIQSGLWGDAINIGVGSATVIADKNTGKSILYFSVPYAGHTLVVLGKVIETSRDAVKHGGDVELTRMYIFNSDDLFVDRLFEDAIYSEFLADNPKFHSSIQGAVNAASSGDTIHVAAGTYTYESEGSPVPAGLIKVTKPLTIKAADGTRPIIDGSGFDGVFKIHPSALTNGDTVIIEGFDIVGDSITDTAITMQGCFDSVPARVIIKNNYFHGMNTGINVWGAGAYCPDGWNCKVGNIEIINNKFYDLGETGITRGFGIMLEDLSNWGNADGTTFSAIVEGNEFYNIYNGEIYGAGIAIPRADEENGESVNAYISGNNFADFPSSIGIAITDGDVSDAIIINNNFNPNVGIALYHLGTGTLDARRNYWADCTGPTGPSLEDDNPSGKGSIIVNTTAGNVLFNPWIGVCITDNKVDVGCTYELNNVTLSANVNSLLSVEDVWFSYNINGINYNKTATHSGSNYSVKILSSELIGGKDITWNVYANDSYGLNYSNGWKTVYVTNSTLLTVVPSLFDGLNGWWITEPLFVLSGDLNKGTNTYYRWGDKIFTYTGTPFGLENIPNLPKESAGILELRWWTDLSCGEIEPNQSRTFKIDLVNPLITNLQPANGTILFGNLKPEISATLTELYGTNSGINEGSIVMKLNGNVVTQYATITRVNNITSNISFVPAANLIEGIQNEVNIYVEDNAGRVSEKTWKFEVSANTPLMEMVVYSPQSGIFNSRKTPFNISLDGKASRIEYINYNERIPRWRVLCTDCEEYGYSGIRQKTKLLNEGENLIEIRATDFIGRTTEQNFSLFIDTKQPVIQKTEPKINRVTNGSDFYIKYSEENLKEVLLLGNKTLNLTNQCDESGKNVVCNIQPDLSSFDGREITYWFDVKDIANNTDSSRPISVLVDTTSPILTVNSPVENLTGSTIYGKRIPFNIVISEDVTLSLLDNSSDRARWQRLCSNCDSYGLDRLKTKYFTEGNHNLTIKATDKAGNSDSQEIIFEVVF